MKIKTKVLCLFLISISLSVFIFLLSTYYILHCGYFSGVNEYEMAQAVSSAAETFNESSEVEEDEICAQLKLINQKDPRFQFAVLSNEIWISDQKLPAIDSYAEMLSAVQCGLEDYKIKALQTKDASTYMICYVNNSDYEALTYSLNGSRSHGIFGKIGLIGAVITLLLTVIILYLFTRKEMKQFDRMQKTLNEFALEHTEARMKVTGKDELSIMAANFNEMAEKLELQYKEKQQYEKNRQELVANLSHDLRTPLSSIVGYSEMLKDHIYDSVEEQDRYIDIIHRKSEYMEYLLTELLEYSRLQLGKLVLEKTKINLTELIREILIEYLPIIEANKYELDVELPDNGVYGLWDKNRIGRVLRNLIENALKYGMDGKKLHISLKEEKEKEKEKVVLEIQDYGIGMKKEEAEHIFDMFYRADGARNSKRGGMGLGMYIVKEIIRLHGGSIKVVSAPKDGTSVIINLKTV